MRMTTLLPRLISSPASNKRARASLHSGRQLSITTSSAFTHARSRACRGGLLRGRFRRAQTVYFGSSPEIAELKLARLLDSPLLPTDSREQAFRRFVAHARLAKVQQTQGKQAEAEGTSRQRFLACTPLFPTRTHRQQTTS